MSSMASQKVLAEVPPGSTIQAMAAPVIALQKTKKRRCCEAWTAIT